MTKKISPLLGNHGNKFPIVAIGASAGGIEAATELLKNLPGDTGMAYIYVQHLDANYKSKLVDMLAKVTSLSVDHAKHGATLKPDCLYIIPPGKSLELKKGKLDIRTREDNVAGTMTIDKAFVSIAEDQGEAAIGILLSGSAHDGTFGLKSIKAAGGITFVQDSSAIFQSMPKSAIAEGVVDMILSPKEMALELERLGKQKEIFKQVLEESVAEDVSTEELKDIFDLLKKYAGVDFRHYKKSTIRRRIIRRMVLYKIDTLEDYGKYLRQHTEEVNVLYQDLLINVTCFFRDPDTLEILKKSILPKLLNSKTSGEPIRIWVPACSTGEEAYSLAIILLELASENAVNIPIQIFATDLSEIAIAKARIGMYSKSDVAEISASRLQRFFTRIDGSYRIVKSIRDLCVFAAHNIFRDPPFSRLDLISCCNLMIYLDAVLQKKIIATFHYALNKNGYLIVGKSETIATSPHFFSQVEKKFKVYARKGEGTERAKLEMTYSLSDGNHANVTKRGQVTGNAPFDLNVEKVVDDILLSKYIPASVVVNGNLEILQFRGSTGLFLEPSPGKASLSLLKMAKPGLSFELRNIVHKATKSGKVEKKGGIEVKTESSSFQASIEAVPIIGDEEQQIFLILFRKMEESVTPESKIGSKDKVVKKLQQELQTLKDDLRGILEEQEASVEELQSANEEVVSSNEELQSINEELETSKEEVESTNEELTTINNELQVRNEQLSEAYEYSQHIFDTIREAVIVVDHDMRVRSANAAFYKMFKMKAEHTEGVIIFELGNRLWDIPELRKVMYEMIPHSPMIEGFEIVREFPAIGEKYLLFNATRILQRAHDKQLILLAVEDITEHRKAQKVVAEREAWFRQMADNAPVMIWVAGVDKKRNFSNKTWLEFTGQEGSATHLWKEAIHPDDLHSYEELYDSSFLERKIFQVEYRLRRHDGQYRWMLDVAKPTFNEAGELSGYIGSCTELHNKKLLQDELEGRVRQRTADLETANKELQRSNSELQQFAYVASHDLQEPLRKIMTFSDRLEPIKANLPEQGKVFLDKISESAQRMTRLIDDLLDYSRIARSENQFVETDLNKVLQEVLRDFDMLMQQKKATIKMQQLPVLNAIPIQMEQLFHNLISNAIKFSVADTAPEINITASDLSPDDVRALKKGLPKNEKYVKIIFKDNGIGFPQEFATQIFVIFQRLNDKKKYPGTGIGLAICNKIVSNHGGEIYARSTEGEGAEFHIVLPLRK